MSHPLPRRTLLAAGTAALASAGTAPAALAERRDRAVPFTLRATVLDGGQQVTAVQLDGSRLGGLRRGELPTDAFIVHARATNPLTGDIAYDADRTVTAARIDHRGTITLELEHGDGVESAATLSYLGDLGRNVQLDLEYTLTQEQDLPRHGRGGARIESFAQGELVDEEVDAFTAHVSASGMAYHLLTPHPSGGGADGHAVVVWLHGGGEGGLGEDGTDRYVTETPLRANRGALGFGTQEAQDLLGGALVVVPQCPSAWMLDGDAFVPLVSEIIEEVAASHRVDRSRIHVTGCSNGGYMSLKMIVEHPGAFASATPICGVVGSYYDSAGPLVTDEQLRAIATPTWLITSADDTTVDPVANTVHAHELIPGSIMSLYDTVTWEGVQYPGHFSWIYAARNDPSHAGRSLWEWMAAQEL
ncbi:prolyl oligopeptidase family serine peptidase [Brachybacterium sp. YJGR34]|uniref:prolyl oligopeptidase family serine peptidase n=1 Tax=Brachybacterium sp. YJGR34 TaxID=2059911 RepID=UPI000E0C6ECF|nr:prolyl oligopeptidase family serine peptidase [Brachybacterium sp. YJGR34]